MMSFTICFVCIHQEDLVFRRFRCEKAVLVSILLSFINCFLGGFYLGTTGIVDYTNYDDMKYAVSKGSLFFSRSLFFMKFVVF